MRAVLMVWLVALPSLMLPSVASDTSQIVMIMALLSGVLIFVEYFGRYPSILEFRFAAPYNRLKFGFALTTILLLSLMARGVPSPTPLTELVTGVGATIGNALDFPYSPVRCLLTMLPGNVRAEQTDAVRQAAGVAYAVSLLLIATFIAIVRVLGWPTRNGAFNVCMNLPLFDPTGGGDVVQRLYRDASLNISLGFVLPFLVPLAMLGLSDFVERFGFLYPQNMIWIILAWSFLPASMVMRGIALHRIAELINQKRRRAYAQAEDEDVLQAV